MRLTAGGTRMKWIKLKTAEKSARLKCFAVLMLIIMFASGLATTFSYGQTWDERTERVILLSNIREVLARIGREDMVISLPCGERSQRISESVDKDHGMAAYYGFFPIYATMKSQTYELLYSWHIYTFCVFFLGVISVLLILKELFGKPLIWFGGTLSYFLTPRFFAESHYNNLDLTFVTFILLTFLFFIRSARKPTWKYLIPYALLSGFLMNCRIPGIAIWFFFSSFLLLFQVIRKRPAAAYRKIIISCFLSFLAYYILTPASWDHPIEFLQFCLDNATHYTGWDKWIPYNGNMIQPAVNGLPYSYLPKWILMTTPEYILILFACSCFAYGIHMFRKIKQLYGEKKSLFIFSDKDYFTGILLLLFWLPFVYLVIKSPSLVLYNGWRHCYFLYAPITLFFLYALDVDAVAKTRKPYRIRKVSLPCVLVLGLVLNTADLFHFHPYEYVYFNRTTRSMVDVTEFEGDYWNVSVIGTLHHFVEEFYRGETLKVALMSDAVWGQTPSMLSNEKLQIVAESEADYYLINTSALPVEDRFLANEFELVYGTEIDGYLISGIYVLPANE